MPSFQPGQRPESMRSLVSGTEYKTALRERVIRRQRRAQVERGKDLASVSALAHVFLETGGAFILALSDEQPSGAPDIHPYHDGNFKKLSETDQKHIEQAYAAVIIGAAVLALTDMMEADMGLFDREYFLHQYNYQLSGTAFPQAKLKDIPLQAWEQLNDGNDVVVPESRWVKMKKRYKETGFADFLDNDMAAAIPPCLGEFIRLQGFGVANDMHELFKQFSVRAKVLVEQDRDDAARLHAEREAAFRNSASMFFDASFEFDLDPQANPGERPNTLD